MKYVQAYQQLKEIFNPLQDEIRVPESNILIRNLTFKSEAGIPQIFASHKNDGLIAENMNFRYPVMLPDIKGKSRKVIILLHGLNERSWHKHLAGAKYLAEKTGTPVVMFPLSFHINRGLPEWTDTRKMSELLNKRKITYPHLKDATIANYALSERLTEFPERFFISGLQSMEDLIKLIECIQKGNHELFEVNTHIDLFSYSISCMLIQALMISNPGHLLDHSKIVFFAGGSLFYNMCGISRYIMDNVAFEKIRAYYLDLINNRKMYNELSLWIRENKFGRSFSMLITPDYMKRIREKAMFNFSENMMVIALQNDRVMPVEGIKQAMGYPLSGRLEILHFPYEYTHENPFPVLYNKQEDQVNRAFRSVFDPVLDFYGN